MFVYKSQEDFAVQNYCFFLIYATFFAFCHLDITKKKVRLFDNSIFRGFDNSRNRGFERDLFSPEVGGNLAPQGGFPLADGRGPGVLAQPLLPLANHKEQFLIFRRAEEFGLAVLGSHPRKGSDRVGIERPRQVIFLQVSKPQNKCQELAYVICAGRERTTAKNLGAGIRHHTAKLQQPRIAGAGSIHCQCGKMWLNFGRHILIFAAKIRLFLHISKFCRTFVRNFVGKMKKLYCICLFLAGWNMAANAAYNLTASKVEIQDLSLGKPNYFIVVTASTSSASYQVLFDVWPTTASAIGSFSAADETIDYYNSGLKKDNGWNYFCEDTSRVELTILSNGDGTCTLSGTIQASRNGVLYTYIIAPFVFEYSEGEPPVPPVVDPYRFEPEKGNDIAFEGNIVNVRDRIEDGKGLEINLFQAPEEGEETTAPYDWIELCLLADTFAMPVGTFVIDSTGAANTLTYSVGYLENKREDAPCYLAVLHGEWGNYTPYYIIGGSLTFELNALGDSVLVTGQLTTAHGTQIEVKIAGENMFYEPVEPTPDPEFVTLAIDTVFISPATEAGMLTFNFFNALTEYPNVLIDVVLPHSDQLTEGTYTMADSTAVGPMLFQNQTDFETFFFGGTPYVFETAELTLTELENGVWQYEMVLTDTIGSRYDFSMTQRPHLTEETGMREIESGEKRIENEKWFHKGHLLILRNGVWYNVCGVPVR